MCNFKINQVFFQASFLYGLNVALRFPCSGFLAFAYNWNSLFVDMSAWLVKPLLTKFVIEMHVLYLHFIVAFSFFSQFEVE